MIRSNMTMFFCLQVILIGSFIHRLVAVPLPTMECLPKTSRMGEMTSIRLVVKKLKQGMSNMHTYGVQLKEKSTHTLFNNGTIYVLREGAKAVFNGREVCIAVKKVSILDQDGSKETLLEECERKCFGVNETAVQTTRIEEGGHLSETEILGGVCCVWSSKIWLEFSMEKPSYKCLKCSGEECKNNSTELTQCTPGVGCFSMVFTMKLANKTTVYQMKGCTNEQILYGRKCWNGCRKMVVNYEMCIECCFADGCNLGKAENTTEISTRLPNKMWRVGGNEAHRNCGAPRLLLLLLLVWVINIATN